MSFIETPRFPEDISFGATGGPQFLTDVVTVNSGAESRAAVWAQGRAVYDVSHAARTQAQHVVLLNFFRAVQGRTHGFRFKDELDYQATTANGVLGTGVGTGAPTYQLGKSYAAGALAFVRSIRKPVSGTVAIYRNAGLATAGSGAGQYALDTTTGIVTWVADAFRTISSVSVGASTALTLASALPGAAISKYVYVTGMTGTAGAFLNNKAWLINNVAGAVVTIAAVTTGLAGTAGTCSMYPQASDALTWSGEFDVPVRFDTDRMSAEIITRAPGGGYIVGWSSIPLIEIRT